MNLQLREDLLIICQAMIEDSLEALADGKQYDAELLAAYARDVLEVVEGQDTQCM